MTKILLVEDDKSLREIYGVRLIAEGYQIISAGDGEQALALAVKEKPDLIISDVMMPKISGFDMLDILRSTPETREMKVIMMTALSSEEQRSRGETLGANRYLVKSQVGIEDVIRSVHDVLADTPIVASPASQIFSTPTLSAAMTRPAQPSMPTPSFNPQATTPAPTPQAAAPIAPTPVVATVTEPIGPLTPTPVMHTEAINQATTNPTMASAPSQVVQPTPTTEPAPVEAPAPTPITTPETPANPVPTLTQFERPTVAPTPYSPPELEPQGDRVISPVENNRPDIADLINQELGDQPPVNQ